MTESDAFVGQIYYTLPGFEPFDPTNMERTLSHYATQLCNLD